MKTRFSSNEELCHVFASQSQETGRANNMFFSGNRIYSYGLHYCIAELYLGNTVLINSKGYGSATGKHTRHVSGAFTHQNRFFVPNVNDPTAIVNVQHLANEVVNYVERLIKANKVSSDRYEIDNIVNAITKFNLYCLIFKIDDKIELDAEFLEEMNLLHAAKLARTKELDSTRDERDALARAKKRLEFEASVQAWKNFKGPLKGYSEKVYLRVDNDKNIVETSRGAVVPLDAAWQLVHAIRSRKNIVNARIGSFTVTSIDDTILTIGCHKIPLIEMNNIFKALDQI